MESSAALAAGGHMEHADMPAERVVPSIPGSAFWAWAGPAAVALFGAFLRFDRLSVPRGIVFDETYYIPDSFSILRHGVEINPLGVVTKTGSRAVLDHLITVGNTHIIGTGGEYVAHPPLGKMMMAVGEWLFGLTPVGWRFSVALVGSLAILMTARIARRMTRSTLLGCVAGLLLALDGLELVLSRTAILDIFVMFWVLAAFGLLVIDRDRTRQQLAAAAASGANDVGGPALGIHWLRVLAGVCLGAACASKWNGLWYIFAFAGLTIAWDMGARHAAGFRNRWYGVLRSDLKWLPVSFVVAPVVVYVASWAGWFANSSAYDRNGAALHGGQTTSALTAWLQYNKSMLGFGLGLSANQSYKSNPFGWLVLSRPISFYSICTAPCGGPRSTEQEVLAIGTPAIWWAGAAAITFCLGWWILGLVGDIALRRPAERDWRAAAVLLAVAAGWVPWIWFYLHNHRTEFYYYAVVFDPFLVIAITLCIGLIIGPVKAGPGRRATGAVVSGVYMVVVLLNFAYLYPILTGKAIPYASWLSRMWFRSWI
jgi:dolichyl-phosphate-mannose-protein mannosyltransferase